MREKLQKHFQIISETVPKDGLLSVAAIAILLILEIFMKKRHTSAHLP